MRYITVKSTARTIPAFTANGRASSRDGRTTYGFPYMSYTTIGFNVGFFVSIGGVR